MIKEDSGHGGRARAALECIFPLSFLGFFFSFLFRQFWEEGERGALLSDKVKAMVTTLWDPSIVLSLARPL